MREEVLTALDRLSINLTIASSVITSLYLLAIAEALEGEEKEIPFTELMAYLHEKHGDIDEMHKMVDSYLHFVRSVSIVDDGAVSPSPVENLPEEEAEDEPASEPDATTEE